MGKECAVNNVIVRSQNHTKIQKLIFRSDCRKYALENVYSLKGRTYIRNQRLTLLNHNKYLNVKHKNAISRFGILTNALSYKTIEHPELINTPYAFGMAFNLLETILIPFDVDNGSFIRVRCFINYLMRFQNIQGIETVRSTTYSNHNYHIYLLLKEPSNALDFFRQITFDNQLCCTGYSNYVTRNGIANIRTSEKFKPGDKSLNVLPTLEILMKEKTIEGEEVWVQYSSEQSIVPLTTVDGLSQNIQETMKPNFQKKGLRLRGLSKPKKSLKTKLN